MSASEKQMYKPGRRGIAHVLDAARYSMKGLRFAWRNEDSFRIETCLLVILLPTAAWLATTLTQFLLLFMSCALVLLTELLNSSLESIVDRISTENHPLSGQAKDLGSAAVFIGLVTVVVVWGSIAWQRFGPPLFGASA